MAASRDELDPDQRRGASGVAKAKGGVPAAWQDLDQWLLFRRK